MTSVKRVGSAENARISAQPAPGRVASARVTPNHVAALLGGVLGRLRADLSTEEFGGLRISHFRLLERVPPGGITISDLSQQLGMTKQAGGQFVAGLTESGYLRSVPDPADGRARIVTRTESGDDIIARVHELLGATEDQWAAHVGQRRYATFRAVLTELLAD